MTISRWATQYSIIDYTTGNKAEENFVRRWIYEHRQFLHNVQVNGSTFTFKAINAVIADFDRAIDVYKKEDIMLQEMEAYFNEH